MLFSLRDVRADFQPIVDNAASYIKSKLFMEHLDDMFIFFKSVTTYLA